MIRNYDATVQALLGTLFTWSLTALGASLVFICKSGKRRYLDGSLGFSAGVMLAASYWSLLAPAIEVAKNSGAYGKHFYLPVVIGFSLGAVFVEVADIVLQKLGAPNILAPFARQGNEKRFKSEAKKQNKNFKIAQKDRKKAMFKQSNASWKRILLLVIAITLHNIPEGLAVGVSFAAVGQSAASTFEKARNLAIGIGIQNFPEGLAVSVPLRAAGMGLWRSFMFGQLSGMVEPVAGVIGALALAIVSPLLPYALAFAAGAMVYVGVDDIIPEVYAHGNGKLGSLTLLVGFVVMMGLETGNG